jgi:2-polyprenyl-3-methyl-5-hydroxy-6-metoxy-1,4-benzoquinol methylase
MDEQQRQRGYAWERSKHFATYSEILGRYIAQTCIDNAEGSSALDLACGDGTLTRIFADRYDRVVAVDASGDHLRKARDRVPSCDFHEALIEDFDTDERFDAVFMVCILEHVVSPVAALRAAGRFLNDRGRLVICVPNANAINRRIAVEMGTLESLGELSPYDIDVIGHRRSYSADTLWADVAAADLEVVTAGGIFYKMLSTPQFDWLLSQGLWEGNKFGWGRVGAVAKDWRSEFCRACYEMGKTRPDETNVIFVSAKRRGTPPTARLDR